MTELINRPEYLNQLIQNRDVNLIKIVTGIRRCGKSSLLDLFHQYLSEQGVANSHIIHMNLESLRYRDLTDYLAFYDYVSERILKEGRTYLIFDELQAVEHWEKAVESFRLDFDVDIYITGSNACLLSCFWNWCAAITVSILERSGKRRSTLWQKSRMTSCIFR